MTLDRHHLILYAVLFFALCGLAGVWHNWRMDTSIAKVKEQASNQVIAEIQKNAVEREKQFTAAIAQIQSMKVTAATPAPVRIQRLQGLEPSMAITPAQLQPAAPGQEPTQLVLNPDQQVQLVNRLADCKSCEVERDKLKIDLQDQKNITVEREKEVATWKTAAKGGSLKQRIWRRAKAFAIDALIIEGARCAAGKC